MGVSIVIVSYNCCYLMQKCIESIRNTTSEEEHEIIVVDNASQDGVADWLKQQKDIKLICNTENRGFPTGCNQGIQAAEPDNDIFLLNNDTRLTKRALFYLRDALYQDEKIGAVGCVGNYCGNEQMIDKQFQLPQDYLDFAEQMNVSVDQPIEQRSRLCGFAMLIKRTALNQTKWLDDNLNPGFFDDDDLSLQLIQAGYRLYVCHNSYIYHAGSQSFSKREDLDDILLKNYNYIISKWGYDALSMALIHVQEAEFLIQNAPQNAVILEYGAMAGNTMSYIQYRRPDLKIFGIDNHKNILRVDTVCIFDESQMEHLDIKEKSVDYILYSQADQAAVCQNNCMKLIKYLKDTCEVILVKNN